jgi:hypothetical protein
LKVICVRLAAPEGFSTVFPDPARTISGFADRQQLAYSFPSMPLKIGVIKPQTCLAVNLQANIQ